MSRKIVFEPHTWIEDTVPYIIPHFPFLLSATSHWIRTHPSQVWPHFNLITSLKTLFPNKATSQIPEVRTWTPLIEQFKSQHSHLHIPRGDFALSGRNHCNVSVADSLKHMISEMRWKHCVPFLSLQSASLELQWRASFGFSSWLTPLSPTHIPEGL